MRRIAKVVLKLPRTNAGVLFYAKNVAERLTGNASLPKPRPSLAVFRTHIAAFEKAEVRVLSGLKGAAKARNACRGVVENDLAALGAYVEVTANPNGESAAEIIVGAGFHVKSLASKNKQELTIAQGPRSGSVVITAKSAGRRVSYAFQYSLDKKLWIDLPIEVKCKTTLSGLTPGPLYYFRFRCRTVEGTGNWSQVVSFRVT
jgi:hypothetical protein